MLLFLFMITIASLIDTQSFLPPDVMAAVLSAIAALLGWIFGKRQP